MQLQLWVDVLANLRSSLNPAVLPRCDPGRGRGAVGARLRATGITLIAVCYCVRSHAIVCFRVING